MCVCVCVCIEVDKLNTFPRLFIILSDLLVESYQRILPSVEYTDCTSAEG